MNELNVTGDGVYEPYLHQKEILNYITKHHHEFDVLGIVGPVGSGKSSVSRSIQLAYRDLDMQCAIVTPTNALVRQYRDSYPQLNILMGRGQYRCACMASMGNPYGTCEDYFNISEKYCDKKKCVHQRAKRASHKHPTVFNVYSYITRMYKGATLDMELASDVVVVDEADACLSSLMGFAGTSVNTKKFPLPKNSSIEKPDVVRAYLIEVMNKLDDLRELEQDRKKRNQLMKRKEKISLAYDAYDDSPDMYAVYKEKQSLHIKPLLLPKLTAKLIKGKKKTIFMSATLFESDLQVFKNMGLRVKMLDMGTVIPDRNKTVFGYTSKYEGKAKDATPEDVAAIVAPIAKMAGKAPVLVHTTYGRMIEQADALEELDDTLRAVIHDKEDKMEQVAKWTKKGGVLFGAGVDTGLDLKGDKCRVNIIPRIRFPSLGDPWVKARKELKDGDRWYLLEALRVIMQSVGRGVRGKDDWCLTVILDPNIYFVLSTLRKRYRVKVPESFLNSFEASADKEELQDYLDEFKEKA